MGVVFQTASADSLDLVTSTRSGVKQMNDTHSTLQITAERLEDSRAELWQDQRSRAAQCCHLVQRLAEMDPIVRPDGVCRFCVALWMFHGKEEAMSADHKQDCVWLTARQLSEQKQNDQG